MIPGDWPCAINETMLARDALVPKRRIKTDLAGFPQRGRGDRCLFCDQYDRCLDVASRKDWEGFHCTGCFYEKKGTVNFFFEEFAGLTDELEPEEEILFGDASQLDRLVSVANDQENFILSLIDQGAAAGIAEHDNGNA